MHRTRRGFTQEELATVAGYSPRLVAKGEGSGNLHPDTIEHLAATLSTDQHPVYPEDLISSPKQLARRFLETYARYERQCTLHLADMIAEDVQILVPGDPELIDFAGEHNSIDGLDQFWGKFFGCMERLDKCLIVDSIRMMSEGNEVWVLTKELAVHKEDIRPNAEATPISFIFEFERGKLKRLEDHFDTKRVEGKIREMRQRKLDMNGQDGSRDA